MAAGEAATAGGGGASEATRWRPAFEAVLHQILHGYEGQEAKVRDGMETGMRKLFERPYEVELGSLRCGAGAPRPLSVDEAQRVIFFPRLSDMRRYVAAFARNTPEATARREKLMKFKMLSVFYTVHRNDGALADRFMHCGGLDSLVALLAEDNNVIQSQAVELLMELLSPLMQLPPATSARQAHLHHQVFLCLSADAFWRNLGRIIAQPAEVFPRSHAHCVRILAGAVGWLRPESGQFPAGSPPDIRETADALKHFLGGSMPVPPDIRGLTEDLLDELLSVPAIRSDPLQGAELEASRAALFAPAAEAREDAAHAWQALRRIGNEAIGAGLVWPAEAAYRLALEEGAGAVQAPEASLIDSNRALALLRAGHPAEAAAAAASALERDPRNVKAAYRRAQALLEQSAARDAEPAATAAAARGAVEAAELAARLEPKDPKVADLLSKARQRLEELGPAAAAAATGDDEELGLAAAAAAATIGGGAQGAEADGLETMD